MKEQSNKCLMWEGDKMGKNVNGKEMVIKQTSSKRQEIGGVKGPLKWKNICYFQNQSGRENLTALAIVCVGQSLRLQALQQCNFSSSFCCFSIHRSQKSKLIRTVLLFNVSSEAFAFYKCKID